MIPIFDPLTTQTDDIDKRIPRHILIVVLETAPREFYPLTSNTALPVFCEMSKHAITSRHHYAMSPYTWWNNASIVSGNYFVQKGKGIFDYGEFDSDSIASILERHGYIATFIDSFKLGWAGTTGFWKNLGFSRFYDTEDDAIPFDRSSYSVVVDKEQSFARDHGFRMRTEFESVGLKAEHGDVAFNVPEFSTFNSQNPKLTGINPSSWLHHGTHVLDQTSPSAHVHDEHKSVTCEWLPLEWLSLHL